MKSSSGNYLSNRVLKVNVGFLLSDGPGNSHNSRFDITERVRVADDLFVNTVVGKLRLSRMKEGILVQSRLNVNVDNQCSRCLDTIQQDITIIMEELYTYPHPINDSEFFIGPDCVLDLAPLLRAEALIEMSHRVLCQEDCQGLCPQCGVNRNRESCDCVEDNLDPRLAKLREMLDSGE